MNEACELLNGDGLRLDQAGAVQVGGLIADTLGGLGLPVEVVDTRVGPTVTTYGLRLGEVQRVKQVPRLYADGRPMLDGYGNVQTVRAIETRSVTANQVISRLKDLQVALGTDSVRVVVPLDADLIGVEAPSSSRPLVPLRAVIETAPMDGSLPVGLGVGDTGAAQSIDLAQMPHLLVAGATGSGKSVWINSMLLSLLVNKSPEELELVLIDPKRVELAPSPRSAAPDEADCDRRLRSRPNVAGLDRRDDGPLQGNGRCWRQEYTQHIMIAPTQNYHI